WRMRRCTNGCEENNNRLEKDTLRTSPHDKGYSIHFVWYLRGRRPSNDACGQKWAVRLRVDSVGAYHRPSEAAKSLTPFAEAFFSSHKGRARRVNILLANQHLDITGL
ncbi:MAG TPA: hypothetical protein PLV61_06280, partial [Parvularculaceae bacterium]|nr:hypothetical protein [Parvularculaceae bacterium]